MSQDTTTPNASTPPSTSVEKKALLDAFDTVLKTQAEERDASARDLEARRLAGASSRPLLAMCTAILLVVGGYLAIAQPSWVFAPRPTPESLAIKEASLRISMANAAQHVQRFRAQTGRLPRTLAEAGAREGELTYKELGATGYRIVGENGATTVTLSSEDSLATFLGSSFQIIARRAR